MHARSAEDETRSPKYAHIERERRWLVNPALRPPLDGLRSTLIEDRYIEGTRLRLRRMTDRQTGAVALKLTKKYEAADPLARPIVTAYLTEAEYAVFATLPAQPLSKSRYKLLEGGSAFSIDCFHGPLDGLELGEIEWPDDAGLRELEPPSWAIRDVSEEPAYQGGALSKYGRPKC